MSVETAILRKYAPGAQPVQATAAVKTKLLKAGSGTLWTLDVTNTGASTVYLLLIDKATAPSGAEVPVFTPIQLVAGGSVFIERPIKFANGIAFCESSTSTSYTDPGTTDLWFYATYS